MTHFDEGTIHAWLDGALEAPRAAEVASHVAGCPACAASVAEARGLIAGASRVLSALDDVPAGVTPKAPAWAKAGSRRHWRAAPWVTGIAAVLVLAIGVRQFNKDDPSAAFEAKSMRGDVAAGDSVALPAMAPAPVAQTPTPPMTPPAGAAVPATELRPGSRRDVAAATGGAGGRRNQPGAAAGRGASAEASAVATSVSPDSATVAANRVREDALKKVAMELPAPAAALLPEPDRLALRDARTRTAAEVAGCYRIPLPAERTSGAADLVGKVAAAAAGSQAERDPARARVAPVPAGGPPVLQPPAMVRLDSTRTARGTLARSVPSDSAIGTWSVVGDSVRVSLPASGNVMLTAANRVTCPQRPE